jgi:hypothetical protein
MLEVKFIGKRDRIGEYIRKALAYQKEEIFIRLRVYVIPVKTGIQRGYGADSSLRSE